MGSGKGVSRVDGYAITDWNAGTVVCLSFGVIPQQMEIMILDNIISN